jgi:tripartite-type tricarboxylate transporter receptor subunit TctC
MTSGTFVRRSFLVAFAVIAAALGWQPARAQDYPAKPITIVTSAPPGGGGDVLTRYLASKLHEVSGATVVVENKAGAAGNIATLAVTNAKPDGYTLLVSSSSSVVSNKFVIKDTNYDAMKDLAPVATFLQVGMALIVPPKTKATNIKELVQELKGLGRPPFYGVPTTSSLFGAEMFRLLGGLNGTRVNYKGMGDAASGIAAGELDFSFVDTTLAIAQAKQGRVKIVAVSPAHRLASEPSVPTIRESGMDFDYINFWAAWAPANTPKPVVDKLSGWIGKVVAMPETREFFLKQGAEPLASTPAELATMMREHDKLWVGIAKATKLEPQ